MNSDPQLGGSSYTKDNVGMLKDGNNELYLVVHRQNTTKNPYATPLYIMICCISTGEMLRATHAETRILRKPIICTLNQLGARQQLTIVKFSPSCEAQIKFLFIVGEGLKSGFPMDSISYTHPICWEPMDPEFLREIRRQLKTDPL
jgi:hypothetical protein